MDRRPRTPEIIDVGGGGGGNPLRGLRLNPATILGLILILILLLWLLRGGPAYTVAAGEEGIVLTFGKYTATTEPGLHFKLPWPIQTVEKANVSEVKRLEIGFRSPEDEYSGYRTFTDDPALLGEAQMLTGDENVVDCSMAVQYRVKNSRDFLFNFERGDVERMLKAVAEAALRQAVGDHSITDVLTTGKFEIMSEIKVKMQELADLTGAGVTIQEVYLQDVQPPREVAAAFKDVASAREEREQIINKAKAYQSAEIPQAKGEAERIKSKAQGYMEARIAEAQGSVSRFQAIAKQYALAPEVTRARLYLEAMDDLLQKTRVTVVDEAVGIVNLRSLGGGAAAPLETAPETWQAPPETEGQQ